MRLGEFTYLDGNSSPEQLPEMKDCWYYEGTKTLEERSCLLEKYREVISADLCEMNLVSNVTGMVPSSPFLSYPIAKTSELANIFIPKEDGGILEKTGVVDVFYNFKRKKTKPVSAAVNFIIVKCENEKMWDILKGKRSCDEQKRQILLYLLSISLHGSGNTSIYSSW